MTSASTSRARVAIFAALLVAAATALFVRPRLLDAVREGVVPSETALAIPLVFAACVVVVAVGLWRLAARRGVWSVQGLLALCALVAFGGMLLPAAVNEARTARLDDPALALSSSADPRVRVLVMELAGVRRCPDGDVAVLLEKGLRDGNASVADAALEAVRLRSHDEHLDLAAARARVAQWLLPN